MPATPISDIPAFALYPGLYFVGSSRVSVHVIKTSEGLLLLDSGYPDMYGQILAGMEQLGLEPKELRAIFLTHGHYDHIGCAQRLRQLSGAKIYISAMDNEIVNGNRELSWARELGYPTLPFFQGDVLVEDGDRFRFGDTLVRARLTPGHTEGTLSYFITLGTGQERITAAMHGGVGTNSMKRDFLDRYGLSLACREQFRQGLQALKPEQVDLVLGNHPGQNDTPGKRRRVLQGLPVTDPGEWHGFLTRCEECLDAMLKKEQEEQL